MPVADNHTTGVSVHQCSLLRKLLLSVEGKHILTLGKQSLLRGYLIYHLSIRLSNLSSLCLSTYLSNLSSILQYRELTSQ